MERAQFVGEDGKSWWLYDIQTDTRIDEARRELGAALDSTEREWFNEPLRRQALYDLLFAKESQLLVDLDTISNDEDRLQWILAVRKLAAPPEPAADTSQPSPAGEASTGAVPAGDKPAAAPPRKSAFKAKAAPDAGAGGSAAGVATADSATPAPAQVEQATQSVLSDLGGAGLADLARELGVAPGDLEAIVNDPDFERQVREEVAKIIEA